MFLTSAFLFDLESNMRLINVNTYQALIRDQWWRELAVELSSVASKERIIWLIETGYLQYGVEGQVLFEDMVTKSKEYEHQYVNGSGLKLRKSQLEDTDANGLAVATKWSRTMGFLAANFPQQELATQLLSNSGAGPTAYDGVAFFHANAGGTGHLLHPGDSTVGRFANLFTSTASANNPGACPISGVSIDVAQANLNKAFTYIRNIKQPNGRNPRKLRPTKLFVPPALEYAALLATQSKTIAMAASSGGGGADVSPIHQMSAFKGLKVVVAEELGALYTNGSDTAYYIGCEDMSGEMGAFTYSNREPFNISYHGPMTDAQLASKREFEWLPHGRSTVADGHPYLLYKVLAT